MYKHLIFAALLPALLAGCVFNRHMLTASNQQATRTEDYQPSTTAIDNHTICDTHYREAASDEPTSITITGPDNIIPHILVVQQGHTLSITTDGTSFQINDAKCPRVDIVGRGATHFATYGSGDIRLTGHMTTEGDMAFSVNGTGDIRAEGNTLKCHNSALNISGTGDIHLARLEANKTECKTNGCGDIHIGDIRTRGFAATINGTGDVEVKGQAEVAKYAVHGCGDIKARQLAVEQASASVNGTGDIYCNAKRLSQSRHGTGDIENVQQPEATNIDQLWNSL